MLTNWLDWLARKLQEPSCLHSSCAVTNACNHTQLYHMGAEDPTSAPHSFVAGIVTNSTPQPAIASFLVHICV